MLKIWADKIKSTADIIKFQISAELKSKRFLCFGTDNPYLQIDRARQAHTDDFVKVYRTNHKFQETNPWWDPHLMTMTEFCNNNKHLPIRLSVYNYSNSGEHKMYGSVEITTRGIEMLPGKVLVLKDPKGRVTGQI